MSGTSLEQFIVALVLWCGFFGLAMMFVLLTYMVMDAVRDWWAGRVHPEKKVRV